MEKRSSERRIVARLVRKIVLNSENHTFKSLRKHKIFVVEGFFEKLLETLLLAVGFFAGFVFGYFMELLGQITFTIALQLRLKAVFAEVFDDVILVQFKIKINHRHDQYSNTGKQKQKNC